MTARSTHSGRPSYEIPTGRHAHAAWGGGPAFAVADFKAERPDGNLNPSVGNVLNSNVLTSVKVDSPRRRVEGIYIHIK